MGCMRGRERLHPQGRATTTGAAASGRSSTSPGTTPGSSSAWLAKKTGKPYRLLTEAEWEYAARATAKATADPHAPFSTGPPSITSRPTTTPISSTAKAASMGIYRQKTTDVGSLPRERLRPHDMHGNVWEWVEDCYKESYAGAPADGAAVASPTVASTSCAAAHGTITPSCCVPPTAMRPRPACAWRMRVSAWRARCHRPPIKEVMST